MGRIVDWVQSIATSLGAPGLFITGFLDSSFLSLPEINDLLLIWMTTQHKSRMVLYATCATLGSLSGCMLLYYVGHKGAAAAGLNVGKAERALATLRRHGVMAVLIPSLLPPPAPFKIFVLLAGVAEIRASHFAIAIAVGRGIRFFTEGFLAIRYGDRALEFISANGRSISVAVATLLTAALAGYLVWKRARRRRAA